jgi:hypothetical protein
MEEITLQDIERFKLTEVGTHRVVYKSEDGKYALKVQKREIKNRELAVLEAQYEQLYHEEIRKKVNIPMPRYEKTIMIRSKNGWRVASIVEYVQPLSLKHFLHEPLTNSLKYIPNVMRLLLQIVWENRCLVDIFHPLGAFGKREDGEIQSSSTNGGHPFPICF